jgi:hypothetical protein
MPDRVRHDDEMMLVTSHLSVIPAKAGIHKSHLRFRHSGECRNPQVTATYPSFRRMPESIICARNSGPRIDVFSQALRFLLLQ